MSEQKHKLRPVEGLFFKALVIVGLLLLVVQVLMVYPPIRHALSLVERLEGVPLE